MGYFDPSAAGSATSVWDAIPLDDVTVPASTPRRTPHQHDEAYAALMTGTQDHLVAPHLAVERTDIG